MKISQARGKAQSVRTMTKSQQSAVIVVGLIQTALGETRQKTSPKSRRPTRGGPSREKSFWANARMARETLPQTGVYETCDAESRVKTLEILEV